MEGFLGEFEVDIKDTEFANYTPTDWALYLICMYGGIDGAHHKDWVLDRVARVLKGTPVKVVQAKWSNGYTEYRISVNEKSAEYVAWVNDIMDGDTEAYSEGIAP